MEGFQITKNLRYSQPFTFIILIPA